MYVEGDWVQGFGVSYISATQGILEITYHLVFRLLHEGL